MHVNRHRQLLEQLPQSLDLQVHPFAPDVVGMPMRRDHANDPESLPGSAVDDALWVPGGVDHEALPGGARAHQVGEIGHLSRDWISDCVVAAGK